MANSVDPDQNRLLLGAVGSGSKLFASILNSAADDFSRQHFQKHFFLGALRVSINLLCHYLVQYNE